MEMRLDEELLLKRVEKGKGCRRPLLGVSSVESENLCTPVLVIRRVVELEEGVVRVLVDMASGCRYSDEEYPDGFIERG